jgi:branched-chain amino acid transport system substrate-binding protein
MKRALIASLALIVASCLPAAAAPEPVRIDAILELSGTAAFLGQGEAQALKILQGVVNAHGGINGRPVEFAISDDQSNPAVALQLMQDVIARKAPAIIGTGFTATCLAIMPLGKVDGPVTYCITPGVHPPAGSFAFSANVGTNSLAPVMLRYFKARGWTRFAFIASTDASGQDMDNAVAATLALPEFSSLTMVAHERFNTTDISVAAQIARIKTAQPQAAIFWTSGTGFGTLLRSAHDAALDVPVMGGNANEIYAQLKQYKDFLPAQLFFPSPRSIAEGGTPRGAIRNAQETYFKAYRDANARPDLPATMAWDPAMIVIDAYRHLGPDTTAEKVRDYISHLKGWTGVNGVYDFTDGSQRGLDENAAVVLRFDGAADTFINASGPAGRLK